jgi:UDP-2,3-diacylglucosamine hydrolase
MSPKLQIKKGALLLGDAHYSPSRPQLLKLIEAIAKEEISITQLIFMGDVFDNLFGSIEYTYKANQKVIDLIQEISQKIEVIYFEGNHDFNLKVVFENIQIIPIQKQPLMCEYNGKKVLMAHGDFDGALGYKIYTALIRNQTVLKLLRFIDNNTNHSIINYVQNHLDKKEDCREFTGFREFIAKRLVLKYQCDYFIEGHFHQNKSLKFENLNYINLAAFACNQRYFIVKSLEDKELLEEKTFSRGM